MNQPRPTRVPRTPPVVRRSVAAVYLGLGMGGLACGGEVLGPGSITSSSDPDGSSDAPYPDATVVHPDGEPDAGVDAPFTDATLAPEASHDASDLYDTSVSDVLGHLHDRWMPPCGIPK
jgi:hypothetical protein